MGAVSQSGGQGSNIHVLSLGPKKTEILSFGHPTRKIGGRGDRTELYVLSFHVSFRREIRCSLPPLCLVHEGSADRLTEHAQEHRKDSTQKKTHTAQHMYSCALCIYIPALLSLSGGEAEPHLRCADTSSDRYLGDMFT